MNRKLFALVYVVALVGLAANIKAGQLWRYPEDFLGLTMQDAIQDEGVGSGDTISVRSGTPGNPVTYYENLNFVGKDILLASRQDPDDPWSVDNPDPSLTIIDGQGSGTVAKFVNGETESAEIRGFTLMNGNIGIFINNSSPTIKGNVVDLNEVHGIKCTGNESSPIIESNEIRDNGDPEPGCLEGVGICLNHCGNVIIRENKIENNQGCLGAGIGGRFIERTQSNYSFHLIIENNVIRRNFDGHGIYLHFDYDVAGGPGWRTSITGCEVDSNYQVSPTIFPLGVGIVVANCANKDSVFVNIENDTISNHTSYGIYLSQVSGAVTLTKNTIVNNATGIHCYSYDQSCEPKMRKNVIVSGSVGIRCWSDGFFVSRPDIGNVGNNDPGYNTIAENHLWNLYNWTSDVIMAEGNWWATSDSATIDSWIYDDDENPNLGLVDFVPWSEEAFIRGDANNDGVVTGADATYIIAYLFQGGPPPSCMDAADANDDGRIRGSDAIYITTFIYRGGPPPPYPYPYCAPDPTTDNLDCFHHMCMGLQPMASGPSESGGNLWLGEATLTEDKLTVPVYLENIKTLHLFGWKVDYDPQLLTAERVDSSGLITEKFDFFGSNKNLEEGWVKAGALTSWTMEWVLPPGSYQVATMVFKPKADGIDVTQVLNLTDIELVDPNGTILRVVTGGGPMSSSLITAPYVFRLLQSQPNPFTTEATIAYSIPKTSQVCLKIYDSSGRLVRTLINEEKDPGSYAAHWDGKTDNGKEVSSGVYFYRIAIRPEGEAGSHKATKKLVRVK